MNRPIKFRIWHKELKKMLYPPNDMDSMPYLRDSAGNHVYIPQGGKIRENGPTPMYPLINNITTDGLYYVDGILQDIVLQQLVLTLDDGTEVYEGDIVSYQDEPGYFDIGADGDFLVIEWDQRFTRFIARSLTDRSIYEAGDCKIDRVDGNIFENPELLKI